MLTMNTQQGCWPCQQSLFGNGPAAEITDPENPLVDSIKGPLNVSKGACFPPSHGQFHLPVKFDHGPVKGVGKFPLVFFHIGYRSAGCTMKPPSLEDQEISQIVQDFLFHFITPHDGLSGIAAAPYTAVPMMLLTWISVSTRGWEKFLLKMLSTPGRHMFQMISSLKRSLLR